MYEIEVTGEGTRLNIRQGWDGQGEPFGDYIGALNRLAEWGQHMVRNGWSLDRNWASRDNLPCYRAVKLLPGEYYAVMHAVIMRVDNEEGVS